MEESNRDLAILRVEREMAKGESPHVLNKGNKLFTSDKAADRLGDSQDMESTLKELSVVTSAYFIIHYVIILQQVKLC